MSLSLLRTQLRTVSARAFSGTAGADLNAFMRAAYANQGIPTEVADSHSQALASEHIYSVDQLGSLSAEDLTSGIGLSIGGAKALQVHYKTIAGMARRPPKACGWGGVCSQGGKRSLFLGVCLFCLCHLCHLSLCAPLSAAVLLLFKCVDRVVQNGP